MGTRLRLRESAHSKTVAAIASIFSVLAGANPKDRVRGSSLIRDRKANSEHAIEVVGHAYVNGYLVE